MITWWCAFASTTAIHRTIEVFFLALQEEQRKKRGGSGHSEKVHHMSNPCTIHANIATLQGDGKDKGKGKRRPPWESQAQARL